MDKTTKKFLKACKKVSKFLKNGETLALDKHEVQIIKAVTNVMSLKKK